MKRKFCLGGFVFIQQPSWQNVGLGNVGAEGTRRNVANFFNRINAAGWTRRDFSRAGELDVIRQVAGEIDVVAIGQMIFQSELISGGINLMQIVDTTWRAVA